MEYAIRNEGYSLLVEQYASKYDPDYLMKCHDSFSKKFVRLIEEYSEMPVCVKNVNDQVHEAILYVGERKTISMDPFFKGTYNLRISRAFCDCEKSNQASFEKLVIEKNGIIQPFSTEFSDIPDGNYILVDDDSVAKDTVLAIIDRLEKGECLQDKITQNKFCESNSLMLFISKLRKGINITDIYLLNKTTKDIYDTVDIRDFLFGVKYSGLVIKQDECYIRKPYIYPFVNLSSRAKIKNGIELSHKICLLNEELYSKLKKITVADTCEQFRILMKSLNIDGKTPMHEVCNVLMRG